MRVAMQKMMMTRCRSGVVVVAAPPLHHDPRREEMIIWVNWSLCGLIVELLYGFTKCLNMPIEPRPTSHGATTTTTTTSHPPFSGWLMIQSTRRRRRRRAWLAINEWDAPQHSIHRKWDEGHPRKAQWRWKWFAYRCRLTFLVACFN